MKHPVNIVTIFERRNISADEITLYSVSSHHQSHHFRREHAYICTASEKGKIGK